MTPPADLSTLVAELRKLEEAATPVPWPFDLCQDQNGEWWARVAVPNDELILENRDNAALIAAMRNALPQLLDALDNEVAFSLAMECQRDALRAALETLRKAGEAAVYALTCGDPQADVLDVFCRELDAAEKALERGT